MTYEQTAAAKRQLEQKRAELVERRQKRLRGDGMVIEPSAESMDNTQGQQLRETEGWLSSRDARLLREVIAALDRYKYGGWAMCECCGNEISDKRMAAVPWASRCVPCQEVADEDAKRHGYADTEEAA